MTLFDKLLSYKSTDLEDITTLLSRTLVQELILREKASMPYWTTAYKELSEKLLSPIEIDSQDLGLKSSNQLSLKQAELLPLLMIKQTSLLSKNSPKIFSPLSISTHVDRWGKDLTQEKLERVKEKTPLLKSLVIRFKPTKEQRVILDNDLHISNYMYNKSLYYIKNKGYNPLSDKLKLRDLLVTNATQMNDIRYIAFSNYIKKIKKNNKQEITKYKKMYKDNELTKDDLKIYLCKQAIFVRKLKNIKIGFQQAKKYIPWTPSLLTKSFELTTHKDVRVGAIFTSCYAYKTAIANIKAGNIKTFNIHYRSKKKFGTAMVYSQKMIKIINNNLYFTSNKMKNKQIIVGLRTQKKLNKLNIELNHDMEITKKHNQYFLHIPLDIDEQNLIRTIRIIGIDPGVRVFMTCFSNNSVIEYQHNEAKLDNLDSKINLYRKRSNEKRYHRIIRERDKNGKRPTKDKDNEKIKYKKNVYKSYTKDHKLFSWSGPNNFELVNKRIRKRKYNKLERKKANLVDELHWKTIKSLLDNNDYIFLGKLDSQGFVKGGKNKVLNRHTNNLKHYKFRTRLIYKAKCANKYVKIVPEHFTTKTCCNCGNMYDPEKSKIYTCPGCKKSFDRDINSAKNILMKGILY